MKDLEVDVPVRQAAFRWLEQQERVHGDVLPRFILEGGFVYQGIRVPLVGPKGIFKPRIMHWPLSITTAPRTRYDDAFTSEGLLLYRYRGTDPEHPDNRGLREAMHLQIPLIYFHGISPGKYLAAWPVFVVADQPRELSFLVAVDTPEALRDWKPTVPEVQDESTRLRRQYVTAAVRQRLHQRAFRERVLDAYQRQCSFCRLRHEELLDAAHIIPDVEPGGEPVVSNGVALCKLHHAAFDRFFVSVRPDYTIEVRPDVLREKDGPTLVHALQGIHNQRIILPARTYYWPDPQRIEWRYQRFLEIARQVAP